MFPIRCARCDAATVLPSSHFPVAGGWWLTGCVGSVQSSRCAAVVIVVFGLGNLGSDSFGRERETFFNFELISDLILEGRDFYFFYRKC